MSPEDALDSRDTDVWTAYKIEIANQYRLVGFTEFILNGYGKIVAKMEFPVLNDMIDVRVSWIHEDSELSICVDGRAIFTRYSAEFTHLTNRNDVECFVTDIVGNYMLGVITGEW
jgi:hypothetical protein